MVDDQDGVGSLLHEHAVIGFTGPQGVFGLLAFGDIGGNAERPGDVPLLIAERPHGRFKDAPSPGHFIGAFFALERAQGAGDGQIRGIVGLQVFK